MHIAASADPVSSPDVSPAALLAQLGAQPLMIEEAFLRATEAALTRAAVAQSSGRAGASGGTEASVFAGAFDRKSQLSVTDDGTAIIRVHGLLINRGAWLGPWWGMTSYEGLGEQIKRCTADPSIKRILLDVDSGGGMVAGIWDLMPIIDAAKKAKPVAAIANAFAASAAYAIACAADTLYVARSSITGSIGVVRPHYDMTAALEKWGIKVTMFKAGAFKTAGSESEALTPATTNYIQSGIDEAMQAFVGHVARYRSIDRQAVIDTQARCYGAADAVALGLADAVASFDEVLASFSTASKPARNRAQSPGALSMTTSPGPGQMSQADMDRIVAGIAEVMKPAAAASAAAPAKPDTLTRAEAEALATAAATAAVAADRARIGAVVGHEAAKGREGLALKLALQGLTADAAADVMAAAPVAAAAAPVNPLAAAMKVAGNSAGVRPDNTSTTGSAVSGGRFLDVVKARTPSKSAH